MPSASLTISCATPLSLFLSLFNLDPFLSAFILCQRKHEVTPQFTSLSALGNSLCASKVREYIYTYSSHSSFSPACTVARVIAPAIHAAFSSIVEVLLCLFLRLVFLFFFSTMNLINLVQPAQKATKREGQVPRTSDKKERGKERSACQRSDVWAIINELVILPEGEFIRNRKEYRTRN